jgi:hypothetical protein|tara:strand:- start:829 stop:1017 length:189 start_codon:yes stop_codon:yes gene_type:complete
MRVIVKPVMRQYEVLLTEKDLINAVGDGFGSDTIHVSHIDRAPGNQREEYMVRICITGVSKA